MQDQRARSARGFDVGLAAIVVGAFVLTAAFRFLALRNGFPNDHFVHLAGAQQMLLGDWPTRDFVDPGLPLMFALSALAQVWMGRTLLSEAVLVAVAFGAGAALTAAVVARLTRSSILAILAVAIEVAVFPRTYGYPKVLLYAALFWLFGRYVERPTTARSWWMAAGVVVAFLFRHDHGLFLFAGGVLTVLLAPDGAGTTRVRRAVIFSAAALALVAPYVVFVEVYQGWTSYLRTAIEFSQREASREGHVWPSLFGNHPSEAALFYGFHLLPLATLAIVALHRRRFGFLDEVARLVPLAAVAVLVNVTFLRDPLNTRLPDAVVPAVVLGAWLVAVAWRAGARRLVTIPLACLSIGVVAASALSVGHTWEEVDRAGVLTGWRQIPGRFRERRAQLVDRFSDSQIPNDAVTELVPFFRYVSRCTTSEHRILNLSYLAEVPVFAQRGFAGGWSFFGSYPGNEANQRRTLERLGRQTVPFVVLSSDFSAEFDLRFPRVAPVVRSRYTPLTDVHVRDDLQIHILVDTMLPPTSRDTETGFPCYRPGGDASGTSR